MQWAEKAIDQIQYLHLRWVCTRMEIYLMLSRDQYTYYAFSNNSLHYAQQLKESIHTPLASLLEIIYQNTYRQAYPAVFKYFLEDVIKWSPEHAYSANPAHHQRGSHDESHAEGVAVASVIFFKLYEKYGSSELKTEIATLISSMPGKDNEEKRMVFVKLLQIAAAFHDAGRLGDAGDRPAWERKGANDCHLFILTLLKNSNVDQTQADSIAKTFSHAAFAKDQKLDQDKPLLNSFIQCADCLEIMRCRSGFLMNYLDIWKDAFGIRNSVTKTYIAKECQLELKKELVYLSLEWRELLLKQGRLKTSFNATAEVRVKGYRHNNGFFRQDSKVRIVSKGVHGQAKKSLVDQTIEHELTTDQFSFLRKYYEFSNQDLNPIDNSITNALRPMDDIIERYVKALDSNLEPTWKSIDRLTIALIDLRQTLKEQFMANGITNCTTQLIQDETVSLMNHLISRKENDAPLTIAELNTQTNAIARYHQKLAHLLNGRQAEIAAAVIFIILAATLLTFSFYLLIPALVATCSAGLIAAQISVLFFQLYCSTVATITSLAVASYGGYHTFSFIANQGLSGQIRAIEEEFGSGVSPLLFPEKFETFIQEIPTNSI